MACHRRPLYTLLEARARAGVAIADLTIIRDDEQVAVELIVDFRGRAEPVHREALCAWAARVGYRRAWFDGAVVETRARSRRRGETRCTGCRARLVDANASFWQFVRHRGAFPTACVLCGSDLPQWTPVPCEDEDDGDADALARQDGDGPRAAMMSAGVGGEGRAL